MSEHHLSCSTVIKGWIPPVPSPARAALWGWLPLSFTFWLHCHFLENSWLLRLSWAFKCVQEMWGWAGEWVWMLVAVMFPGAPVCDGAICSSPKQSRAWRLKRKRCLKFSVLGKCNHCELSARSCLWTKMEPELGTALVGVPYTDTKLSVPLQKVVTPQQHVTSGDSWQAMEGDLPSQLGKTSRQILLFWPGKPGWVTAVFHK